VAIHVGYARARWLGLVVAGSCFILPAALIVAMLAALYVHYLALRRLLAAIPASLPAAAVAAPSFGLLPMFLFFLKSQVIAKKAQFGVRSQTCFLHRLCS